MVHSLNSHRWMMTAPGAPLIKAAFDLKAPGAGEVIVEIAGCGLCHTDLGYYYDGVRTNAELPLALGHEISGRVIAAGAGAQPWVGKAVIVPAVLPCGDCDLCRRGRGSICRNQKMPGNDIQGGFATHIYAPVRGLCPVDDARLAASGLGLADLAVVADAMTTPFQAATRAGVKSGDLVIVVGVGGVGGYAVQIADALGAIVIAIDVDAEKLGVMAQHGAALTLNAREMDGRALKQAVAAFAKQRGLSSYEWVIFECSGTPAGQTTAYNLLVHGATLCVVGFTMAKVELRLSNLMAFDARAIGNWGCPPELYPATVDLVLTGRVKVAPFVRRLPLDDINRIFADAHAHKFRERPVLVPATVH